MQPHEFCHHFRNNIRVQLDWKQFCSSSWPIEHLDLAVPSDSANIYTPWYALASGKACNYADPGAQPQSVALAAVNPELLSCHGVSSIAPSNEALLLPAYRLSNGAVLLLDGNHRVVAAQATSVAVPLALFVIHGPMCSSVLPDLCHWV